MQRGDGPEDRAGFHLEIDTEALQPPSSVTQSLVERWTARARDEAVLDVLNYMQDAEGRDAYRKEMVERVFA